jgi:hypothetical protein
MWKIKEIKIIILSLFALVLVSWNKLIFTGSLKVDDNPLSNVNGWIVVLAYAFFLFFYARSYYRIYKYQQNITISHHQVKLLAYIHIVAASLMLPFLSNDIFIYMAYGDVSNLGIDVFTQTNVVQYSRWYSLVGDWKDAPYSYGPITLWVGKLANWAGGNNVFMVLLSYKILWFIIAAGFIEIISLTVKHIGDFIWIAFTPVLWLQCVANIHYDLLGGFFLLIAIYFISQQKIVFSLVAIALACNSKIIYIIFIPFILGHYFLINPQRLGWKPVVYFLTGMICFGLITVVSYFPFWNGIETIQTPFAYLNKVEPSKSFSEVAGELLNLAFPRNTDTSVTGEITSATNSTGKVWWWKQCQLVMNIFGVLIGIILTIIFVVKTKLKINKQVLAEFWVKLCVIFFFFYSHVFNIWYFIALLPFIPLLGNNDRLKKYLLIICIYSNLHMIMLNVDHHSALYYFNPLIILLNICLFVWQFRKNFLTIESPVGKHG